MVDVAPRVVVGSHTETDVVIGSVRLTEAIRSGMGFLELLMYMLTARRPDAQTVTIVESCMVAMMEGGINPSSAVTHITAQTTPSDPQVAIAAGLLSVNSVYAGSSSNCAEILYEIAESPLPTADACDDVVARHAQIGARIPGLGHALHRVSDPRADALLAIGRGTDFDGRYLDVLEELVRRVNRERSTELIVNVTGVVAALLAGVGLRPPAIRGVSAVARSAGLLVHALDEPVSHLGRRAWRELRERSGSVPDRGLTATKDRFDRK